MRISVPERITIRQTLTVAVALLCVQLLEETDVLFALLTFAYIVIFAISYNVAGGLYYPSGAWIFFTATGTALIGILYKALLVQPGQSNLQQPTKTLAVYCAGLAGMGLAAWLSKTLRPRVGLLENLAVGDSLKHSAIGCLILGFALSLAIRNASHETATVGSALSQLDHFMQLAILLGTVYQIRKSGGRSSTNWIVWTAGLYLFVIGLLSFSKEGMFSPLVTWFIPAVILRLNFSKVQIIGAGTLLLLGVYYFVPYSQAGRASRDKEGILANNLDAAIGYLTDLQGTRALYLQSADVLNISDIPHFYNGPEGLFDRLQMLAFDDALIAITDQGSIYGLEPAYGTFLNSIPRFFWKDKPEYKSGNVYGQQIGVLSDSDTSTGISFSPTGDAYHEATWFGVIIVEPIIMFILFIVSDALSGDVRRAPWGMLFLALFAHAAPEGELPGPIWLATFGAESVLLAALFAGYAIPSITRLLSSNRLRSAAARPNLLTGRSPMVRRGVPIQGNSVKVSPTSNSQTRYN